MPTLRKEDIDRCFDRLTSSGDLQTLFLIISDARALVERELLQKLASFPLGSPEDIAAFAYRQGWLRALIQMQALFQPERTAERGRGPLVSEVAFRDDDLGKEFDA